QGTTPLGLELSLANPPGGAWQVRRGQHAAADPPRLLARLVRPGKNGGWVNGGLSWIKLDSMNYAGEYPEHQVRLLRELYALYRASRSAGAYYGFSYGDERTIEMSAFESPRLWPLLDEAAAAGIRLVYPRKLGQVGRICSAEMCMDATRPNPGGAILLTPALRR